MKSLPKIFVTLCLIAAVTILLLPAIGNAQGQALEKLKTVGGTAYGAEKPRDLPEIIGSVIKSALTLLGVGAALLIIYAGYLWMTARGKEERVTKAKDTLEAAVIGLIIIIAAYAITYFVVDRLMQATGATPSETTTPPPTP
jgi:Na+-driven multidrug efflux pump